VAASGRQTSGTDSHEESGASLSTVEIAPQRPTMPASA
jgi:hypothetical protein